MALPIFLRPLLLISHYYRRLTRVLTGWLEQSNDQLFGPLEQMIVAVVITGLAMNPGLLPQFRPQMPVGMPIQSVPVYHQQESALSSTPPQPVHVTRHIDVNATSVGGNATSLETTAAGTDHTLLDFLPSWRLNPIVVSLIILMISVAIYLVPSHLFQRVKHSWNIFWPPWQDRSNTLQASRSGSGESTSRPTAGDVPTPRVAKASAVDPDGNKIEPKVRSSAQNTETDEEKAKRKAILAYQAKKAAAAHIDEKLEPKVRLADDLNPSIPVSESVSAARSPAAAVIVDPKEPEEGKSQSEKARDAKSPIATAPENNDQGDRKKGSTGSDSQDPLMAGDVRPLRSILKKSKKKPRQSKNVHHNHFMTMRGNRAHLVPFPHGLHPPPDQPRSTLWRRNIPKSADHIMAPPPVPKAVTDVLAGEDPVELAKKATMTAGPSVKLDLGKEAPKAKEADKEKLKEREKLKMAAELEAKERAKALQAKERAGTATASVSIELPSQPDIQVDPQVQKATWASQAVLCLLLFYIQEQLGLALLAFFVWQQLNATAARHSGEVTNSQQPIATATARAAAPPPRETPAAVKLSKEDEIPAEMKEKMARAKAEKEARAKQGSKDDLMPTKLDKGKGKEVARETLSPGDKATVSNKGDKAVPRALTTEERAAYRARIARDPSSAATPSSKSSGKAVTAEDPMTQEKWAKLSDEEKKRYMADREKRKRPLPGGDPMTTEKWSKLSDKEKKLYMSEREKREKAGTSRDPPTTPQSGAKGTASSKEKRDGMSDEEKRRFLAEREKRRSPESREAEAAAKAEKWDKMSDEDKQRYLQERQKREQARRAALKVGEGSGLSAEDKENL